MTAPLDLFTATAISQNEVCFIPLEMNSLYASLIIRCLKLGKHSKKCTFYTLRFGCSFAAVNTIKPQLL